MTDRILKPLRPSAALTAWYRRKLEDLVHAMARSMLLHIRAACGDADPAIGFAADASPTDTLERAMAKWGKRAIKRFDDASDEIARIFATRSRRDFDTRFRRILREAGITVQFKPTPQMTEAYRSVIAQQVALIRSIPQKFLTDVQTSVWQAVMKGSDMAGLEREIRRNYGVTWRRAALISRDQVTKSRAVFERARRVELGIKQAIWQHTGAGTEPRPTHVRMSGKKFDVERGMWDSHEQAWIQPGELINCRCISKSVFSSGAA